MSHGLRKNSRPCRVCITKRGIQISEGTSRKLMSYVTRDGYFRLYSYQPDPPLSG